MFEINKIHNTDCLEGLKKISSDSVDLTITSPPYDDIRKYNGYSFNFEGIATELYRVTKKGGIVVWVVGDRTNNYSESGSSFSQALFFKNIGFNLYDTMIFAKVNPPPKTQRRYEQQFEYMFVFSKGRPNTFNPIKEKCKKYNICESGTHRHNNTGILKQANKKAKVKQYKIKPNIWYYNVGTASGIEDKEASKHPAIFPEQLAEDHIKSWSKEGDLVMDIFMGSGTTAKMAILNNRNFIGFEISKEYTILANERINKYTNNHPNES